MQDICACLPTRVSSPEEDLGGEIEHRVRLVEGAAQHRVHAAGLSARDAGPDDADEHRRARHRQQDVVTSL